jgi:hypothetical protein
MAEFAVNGLIIVPVKLQPLRCVLPRCPASCRAGSKIHHLMQSLDLAAVGFSGKLPWVARLASRRDFHGFGKMRGPLQHALLKIWAVLSEFVFTFGARFGQFGGFAIALKSQADAASILRNHKNMGAKARLNLALALVFSALGSTLKCVAVGEVITGT